MPRVLHLVFLGLVVVLWGVALQVTKANFSERVEVSDLRTERTYQVLRRSDGAQITVEALCLTLNGQPHPGCSEAKRHYREALRLLDKYARVVPLQKEGIRRDVAFSVVASTDHPAAFFVRAYTPHEGLEFGIALPLRYDESDGLVAKIGEADTVFRRMAAASGSPAYRID